MGKSAIGWVDEFPIEFRVHFLRQVSWLSSGKGRTADSVRAGLFIALAEQSKFWGGIFPLRGQPGVGDKMVFGASRGICCG
jgi:hypothetical protein